MVPKIITCKNCSAEIQVKTWKRYVVCPYCNTHIPFEGFDYRRIDWSESMYAHVKKWTDCPACHSPNMYLGPSGRKWKCPDCGYVQGRFDRNPFSVLWFCDECEAYLNIQPGFTTKNRNWKCTECRHISNVTRQNII